MKDERSHHLLVLGLRIDEWRTIYNCKRVPRSAITQVFEKIGWPVDPMGDSSFMEAFFIELKNQRPDLFKQPKQSSERKPTASQGCLVCALWLYV
jgi:hypothetical protein